MGTRAISPEAGQYIKKASAVLDKIFNGAGSYACALDMAAENGLIQDPHTERMASLIQLKLLKLPAPSQEQLNELGQAVEKHFARNIAREWFKTMVMMALDEEGGPMSENARDWCLLIFKLHDPMRIIIDHIENVAWEGSPSPSQHKKRVLAQLWENSWRAIARQPAHFRVLVLGQLADKYSVVEGHLDHRKDLIKSVGMGIDAILSENKDIAAWRRDWNKDIEKIEEMKSSMKRYVLRDLTEKFDKAKEALPSPSKLKM